MAVGRRLPVSLVTGASSGIGQAVAVQLANAGYTVVATGRDEQRLAATVGQAGELVGRDRVDGVSADLSRQSEVRRLAEHVRTRYGRLDVLVNNAGAITGTRRVTEDGQETNWAVNYLAPFLLTNLLLGELEKSAPARVVNVTSAVHRYGRIDLGDVAFERRRFSGRRAYGQSKLAVVMFTVELARRLAGTRVTVNCVHPGVAGSRLGREGGVDGLLTRGLARVLGQAVSRCGETVALLATSPEVADVSGTYFQHRRPGTPHRVAADGDRRGLLWELSMRQTGLTDAHV